MLCSMHFQADCQRCKNIQNTLEETRERVSEFKEYLASKHKVKKMFGKEEVAAESSSREKAFYSSGFFLLFGGQDFTRTRESDHKIESKFTVRFAWEYKDSYVISKIALEKMRVKIIENQEDPEIKIFLKTFFTDESGRVQCVRKKEPIYDPNLDIWRFPYNPVDHFYNDQADFFENNLAYVEVTCKENDWPTNIEMPFNKEKTV